MNLLIAKQRINDFCVNIKDGSKVVKSNLQLKELTEVINTRCTARQKEIINELWDYDENRKKITNKAVAKKFNMTISNVHDIEFRVLHSITKLCNGIVIPNERLDSTVSNKDAITKFTLTFYKIVQYKKNILQLTVYRNGYIICENRDLLNPENDIVIDYYDKTDLYDISNWLNNVYEEIKTSSNILKGKPAKRAYCKAVFECHHIRTNSIYYGYYHKENDIMFNLFSELDNLLCK